MAEWSILVALSISLVVAMRAAHLPGALLLGPMIAAILLAVSGAKARLSRTFSVSAQTILGCLIARVINPALLAVLAVHWAILIGLALASLILTALLGLLITHRGWLPGTAAIWGLSPDTAVIIAASTNVSLPLVLAAQLMRLILVIVAGPEMARWIVRWHRQPS